MQNSTALTMLAIAIMLAAFTIPASAVSTSKSTSLSLQPPYLSAIFKQAENSVVQITSKVSVNNTVSSQTQNATALGSGFVYDNQGHIITNEHVVGRSKTVDVTFIAGNRYVAKVVGTDIYSDLAVIQITYNATQSLKPLIVGNSSKLEVGDPVIAIGNPFGLSDTMTTGIVSGISRLLPAAGETGFSIPDVIQTDAPINPGNSGGPLLNIQGQVVGINTAAISDNAEAGFSGVGFAIPSTTIMRIVPALIEKGHYIHPYIGLTSVTLTSDLAETINGSLPTNFKGVYVDSIKKNGPADKAGIHGSTIDQYSVKHGGDIITAVDGHTITRSEDLTSYIDDNKSVGDSVTFTVYRNGHALNLKTTLAARPSPLQ
ncbi:MAG TPA: trypsin-like peptidase domain-containing protein [Nitrososphaeraceae archaeon]|nr:trypsin-like peptidase domain-containing protein [Nitrososphaeraceae archaeon]